jgi:hypothetical protein
MLNFRIAAITRLSVFNSMFCFRGSRSTGDAVARRESFVLLGTLARQIADSPADNFRRLL